MAENASHHVMFLDVAPFTGGAQCSLITLIDGLEGTAWTPHVLTADRCEGGILEHCRGAGVPVEAIRAMHWRKSAVGLLQFLHDRRRESGTIRRACRRWSPALIHANGVRAALMLPRSIWQPIPLVVHDRDVRVPALAVRLLAKRTAHVLAISAAVARKWQDRIPQERLSLVPNGFDLQKLRWEAERAVPDMRGDGSVVILVADMVPWKRHKLFLDALCVARERNPALSAMIVGRSRGTESERYARNLVEHAVHLGLSSCVQFVGDASCALPWIAGADVLVSTAAEEPFGRTVVEALALGKPVVAVNSGGPADILAGCEAGILVESCADAVADGMLRALRSAGPTVTAAALARAEQFSAASMTRAVCGIYSRIRTDLPRQ